MSRFVLLSIAGALAVAFSTAPAAQSDPHRRSLTARARSMFAPSTECVACHNGLQAASGEDVSIGTTWRSTMMANAARDPYFQAGLRREVMEHPSRAAEIQHECAACHAPMLQRALHADGRQVDLLRHLAEAAPDAQDHLATDGVSCTVCHQIADSRLGTKETSNGRFDMAPPDRERQAFGPFGVNTGRARIMSSVTGFVQREAPHVRDSALCASCHTLYTRAHGASGAASGELPEQMTFDEWKHSAFYGEQRSCQSCHMPAVAGHAPVASVLGEPREGMARHVFVGGNFLVLRMLDRLRGDLHVEATSSELAATAHATVQQLTTESANVAVAISRSDAGVVAAISVRNLAGHKFPSGYPSRRAWLHVTARDAQGRTLFESGAVRGDGAIAGNDNDDRAAAFEPHYDRIERPDQVQIYESILSDGEGTVTTGLLRATQYLKDNRLLPRGFAKDTAHRDIAVYGEARRDGSFTGGEDVVRYLLPTAAAAVHVELRYQPIAFRWADNLRGYEARETRRFLEAFAEMASTSSVVVAEAVSQVP